MQADLFAAPAASAVSPAPALQPHTDWPFPGLDAEDSARAALANSEEYADMLAAVLSNQGEVCLTSSQLLALVPDDWKSLLGRWAHASLSHRQGEARSIDVNYVGHEGGGGFHFTYRATGVRRPAA